MDKRFILVLVGIAVILGGVFFVTNAQKAGAPAEKGSLTNHVEGNPEAKVKLVEYGDFQCPACGQYYQTFKDVAAKYSDSVQVQFRNFPLSSLHPNAIAAARAAEAAGKQNKYWEMHDKLYEENYAEQVARVQNKSYTTWTTASDPQSYFETYATGFGLDIAKFRTDFKSSTVNGDVQADLAEGNRLGVNSTPTFFINGKKISNPDNSVEGFSKIIDAELKKQGVTATTPAPAAAAPAESTDSTDQ